VFGDQHEVSCRGSLLLTDIRVLFVPCEAVYPAWTGLSFGGAGGGERLTEEQQLLVRRLTYIMPVPGLQEVRVGGAGAGGDGGASLTFFGRDGSAIEFRVPRAHAPAGAQAPAPSYRVYRAGLRSEDVLPLLWCQRVADEIQWQLKERQTWVRFAKYLRAECEAHLSPLPASFTSIAEATRMVDLGADFRRLRASEDWAWEACTLNGQYRLCSTYSQSLYFPAALSEAEISLAAKARSRGRLPVLSWIHPETGVPLTRAAQPKIGRVRHSMTLQCIANMA
jgi:hypothetical protein